MVKGSIQEKDITIVLSQKRNAFVSVLMRWMNLEPIIYSEVSQKEKNIYHTLMHVHGT